MCDVEGPRAPKKRVAKGAGDGLSREEGRRVW